ncbi:MAG: tetratricopeptide repeat protein [Myxococcales bacterium]|nr:tetratricopeptide repeat protein [Myxococcales bacterium]
MSTIDDAWKAIRSGKPAGILGAAVIPVPVDLPGIVVRASCDVPRETFGPLWALSDRAARLLGEAPPLMSQARQQVFELGRRLLGERADHNALGAHVAIYNRLAAGKPVTLVLDAVDEADDATIAALEELLSRKSWLKASLVLGVRSRDATGRAKKLLQLVEAAGGVLASLPEPAKPAAADARSLGDSVITTLRAASLLGAAFEVELLARLLGKSKLDVLFDLQRASDAGFDLVDRGDGTVVLDQALAASLAASLLPSLRTELHRRAAELVETAHEEAPASATEEVGTATTLRPAEPQRAEPQRAEPQAAEPQAQLAQAAPAGPSVSQAAEDPPPAEEPPSSPRSAEPAPDPAPRPKEPAPAPPSPATPPISSGPRTPDPIPITRRPAQSARAAEHRLQSGEPELAAERMLTGARQAAQQGAHRQAEALARRALGLLERIPRSTSARALEVRALLEIGRIRLEGFAPSEAFQLDGAIEVLEAAKAAASTVAERCEASRLLATAHYERGDLPSLERALAELTEASRLLLEAGDATGAAGLLNDQAAVYLRMGDPVRAMALAEQSRAAFEQMAESRVARQELAETDLLIARIPLHVPARPGREADALAAAIDHALAAARVFESLGQPLARARALETLGRLELARGRVDRAVEHLKVALMKQEQLADLIGLARTAGALSEALARSGKTRDALALLAESIEMNRAKGSSLGVALNRRALESLQDSARSAGLAAPLREVEAKLLAAEELLGAISLPGEADRARTIA